MKKLFNYYNLLFWIPLIVIITISLLDMHYLYLINNTYQYHFYKELIWIMIGFCLLLIITFIKPKILLKISPYLYLISLGLLILVLFIGNNTNGSMAWFKIGFIKFQPSELMKLSLILYLSSLSIKSELIYIIKIIIITLVPSILVFLEPDTGAVIIYLLIMISFIFNRKIKRRYQISFIVISLLIIGGFILIYYKYPTIITKYTGNALIYRINRLINIKSGYQIDNALTAIGSTQLISFKPNNKLIYIPEAHTDFIFAYTISLFGFISGLLLIICYFIISMFLVYKKGLIKNSLLIIFTFQVIYNLGFNIGLFPIMGIPLPFLSYGGSNIIIYFLLFGLLFNMDDNSNYNHKHNQGYNKALALGHY